MLKRYETNLRPFLTPARQGRHADKVRLRHGRTARSSPMAGPFFVPHDPSRLALARINRRGRSIAGSIAVVAQSLWSLPLPLDISTLSSSRPSCMAAIMQIARVTSTPFAH